MTHNKTKVQEIIFYHLVKTLSFSLIFLAAYGTVENIMEVGLSLYNLFGVIITMLIFGIVSFALDMMRENLG